MGLYLGDGTKLKIVNNNMKLKANIKDEINSMALADNLVLEDATEIEEKNRKEV
jgi:hypothetical protein